MSLHLVSPGAKAPEEFNVIIEIPMNADPIKYEVDKESGALFVDRFMGLALRCEGNPTIWFDRAPGPNRARPVVHYRTDARALFDIALRP